MGDNKFYLSPHNSAKKEKISLFQPFETHCLYQEYFTMSNTHMKQQVVLLDLLNSTRKLPVPRLGGRLGQVRCRKASWSCFGGRSFQNGGRKHESSAS